MRSTHFGFGRVRALLVAVGALAVCAIGAPAAFAAPPANDNFASAQALGATFNVSGTNLEATASKKKCGNKGGKGGGKNRATASKKKCGNKGGKGGPKGGKGGPKGANGVFGSKGGK